MRTDVHDGRLRRFVGLFLVLALSFGFGAPEARKKDGGGKCEGTKKQRKQKMPKRDITDEQLRELIGRYEQDVLEEFDAMKETALRRLQRELEASRKTGEPFVYDILVISGGGAKGAFGAGFFQGWGEIESGPFARPEFDMVTGVSTGALLAPFAYIGTDESYDTASDFYAHPGANWTKKRGLIEFWPSHISMFNNCHLHDTVRNAMDPEMIGTLADAAAEDRLLLIGATNIDIGVGRVFDLGRVAQDSREKEATHRVASILLASSAIPGAFPPIEIDGMLYADGGSTSNLFIASFPGPDGVFAQFVKRNPDAPFPKVRVWVLVNQPLKPQHVVTQPKWLQISGRALGALTSTNQLFALELIRDMVHKASVERGVDAELHLVSIPEDAPKKTTKEMFDVDYMNALQDLGRQMGADPSNWTDTVPSPYRVEAEWIDE